MSKPAFSIEFFKHNKIIEGRGFFSITMHHVFIILLFIFNATSSFPADWSIGIYSGNTPFNLSNPPNVTNPVLNARHVTSGQVRGFADPFMVIDNNMWYMFFEIIYSSPEAESIGLATSNDGLHWSYGGAVLSEPFHLAYPYTFKWQNVYYMIPDTFSQSSIRLYRATNFPTQWEYVKTLISGRQYVDSSVVYFNNRWWLFTSVPSNDTLYLFYSDDLMGPWVSHSKNPIISGNANKARPGGRIVIYNGTLLRYAQDDDPSYGNATRVFEITDLTTTTYSETEMPGSPVVQASGNGGWNNDAMHTIDSIKVSDGSWIACVDGLGTPDTIAPTVIATSPADQATGFPINSAVSVTFSESMDTTFITSSTFTVSNGNSIIAGNITFATNGDRTVATFTPTTDLFYRTTYTGTITTGVKDDSNNALAQDYVWTFTTGPAPDTTPPNVSYTLPPSGATGVSIGSTVNVTFNELIDISSITGATFVVAGGGRSRSVTGSISFATSSGKTVATLTPSSALAYGTLYTGTVTTGVVDLASNPMVQNFVWTFTTEVAPDTTPPTVISTVPDAGASGVSLSTPITVTFSETMDQSSFVPTAFILTGGGVSIPCTAIVAGSTATFTPYTILTNSTSYTATVTTVAKDQTGNAMAVNKAWSFTTELTPLTPPPPPPPGGGGGCSVSPTAGSDEQSKMGIFLAPLSPALILAIRKRKTTYG